MNPKTKLARLTHLLRTLGAPDPEAWAASELEEGIPQTARFLFLRQAWRNVVSHADHGWIDRVIQAAERKPDDPHAGAGHALKRLRARGAADDELTELVRAMQAELLFSFCYLLEDPGDVEPEAESITWSLFVTDEDGEPTEVLGALHESVLETDPEGREVRPPPDWLRD
jgi:hypothetical protein